MPAPSHDRARQVLTASLKDVQNFKPQALSKPQQAAISAILLGDHKTFRYILITALLGKVVEPRIHMRSLQQGADLNGAYDARSLCHDVWVPFEREHLDNRLGGSNEPYLNKPARFPAIEKTNAVRAGSDKYLLDTMFDLLEALNGANAAQQKEAFLFAMTLVMSRTGSSSSNLKLTPMLFSVSAVENFVEAYRAESWGGEVPVSLVGAMMTVRHEDEVVKVHPANQAGTSSNEVGDIDVYSGKAVVTPVEVKDKTFGKSDVDHACRKAQAKGCKRLLFVIGPNGRYADGNLNTVVREHAGKGFDLAFAESNDLLAAELRLFSDEQRQQFINAIDASLTSMRSKDETRRHFTECLKRVGFTA